MKPRVNHPIAIELDDNVEAVLFLMKTYCVAAPRSQSILERYYDDPHLNYSSDITAWKDELIQLQSAYTQAQKIKLQRERNVHAKDPEIRKSILNGFLQEDTILKQIKELIAVCNNALAKKQTLKLWSD